MDSNDVTREFYGRLDELEHYIGGRRRLAEASGRMRWPDRGVYFFFEPGEPRCGSGEGPRVVRVGTHALKLGSRTKLWARLRQHRGTLRPLGGNHRGSIFRKLVGDALIARQPSLGIETWGKNDSASKQIREAERPLEILVSQCLGEMTLLFLPLGDAPGPDSDRGFIERNSIALLSAYVEPSTDAPSPDWLGHHSTRERVRRSGLWNNNHVDAEVDPRCLEVLRRLVKEAASFMG